MSKLSGMTGFARTQGTDSFGSWVWEARSVNGKSLDVRINTPQGFDMLHADIRTQAGALFSRGNIQISLKIEPVAKQDGSALTINTAGLNQLKSVVEAQSGENADTSLIIAQLLQVRGIVTPGADTDRLGQAPLLETLAVLRAGLKDLLLGLQASRLEEGAALHTVLEGLVSDMGATLTLAATVADQQPAAVKSRLEAQLDLLGVEGKIDADRVATEIALSASKSDVREELDRFAAHLITGRNHLANGSPAGRNLDFLAQEFRREVNTLCSKSVLIDLTNHGLALKSMIDQFKEQAANVE